MGRIICTGLGPGDPELISVRADRLVRGARHLAYFRKAGRAGQARKIVEGMVRADVCEYPMEYPVTTELPFDSPEYRQALGAFYDLWAERLGALAQQSGEEDIIVLCEGDPFFYGSFMHLYTRLQGRGVEPEVVPGITGMSGCWTRSRRPITWGDDVLSVIPATLPEPELVRHIGNADALVVMKTGRNLAKLRRALKAAGRLDAAFLVENGTMEGERITRLAEVEGESCPYFATVLVHGRGRGA